MNYKSLLPALFLLALMACSGTNQFTSYWNSKKSNLFQSEAQFYHPDDQISIKVFNNSNFIDIILETNSSVTLRKIYNLGLSLWMDPNGKSKAIYAVHFPMPVQYPFTDRKFEHYLTGFSKTEFQEELIDRFQEYELIDTRINESLLTSTINRDEAVKVELKTTNQVLFSYHARIPVEILYGNQGSSNSTLSIGIASVNEAKEEYYSAMSSKEVIRKRMDELKAGAYKNKSELEEWWVNFKLSEQ